MSNTAAAHWQSVIERRPELKKLLQPRLTKYITHTPTPKQAAFLLLSCREAFYGGAAGGGKSDALLAAALQYVDVPGYASILFRRTHTDLALPGALMDRAHEWLAGTDAHWSEKSKTWDFPSGATLTFGYLDGPRDKDRYQSAEFQYIGFDELTHFRETDYRYLFSRLRRLKDVDIPLRMRAASNPGGIGHEWVKQRFITEHKRPFIPARLDDNQYIDREEYEASLAELDPMTRAQLLAGDWDVIAGGEMFKREWFEIVQAAPVSMKTVRFWDLAATAPRPGTDPDYTVGLKMGRAADGTYYVLDIQRIRQTAGGVKALIKQTAAMDGIGTLIRMEQEGGGSGKIVVADFVKELAGYAFKGIPSGAGKDIRAMPVASQAEAGNVKLVQGPWLSAFLDEVALFPQGAHDDQVDGLSGAFNQLAVPPAPKQVMRSWDG